MEKFLVILVSFLVILSFAKEKPLIIIYQMKIVELSEETVLKLGLEEGNFEKDTEDKRIFNVIYDPMLMELLFKMSQMVLKIDLGKSNIKEIKNLQTLDSNYPRQKCKPSCWKGKSIGYYWI